MIKRISFIVFSFFLSIALFSGFIHHKVLAVASNQTDTTSIFTFTIQGGNGNDLNDKNGQAILKSKQVRGYNIIALDASLHGRTAELPVGSLIFLHFPTGEHNISINPAKGVVEGAKGTYNPARGDIAVLQVVGQGTATITVTEVKSSKKGGVSNSTYSDGHWSGYVHKTGGAYTDVTSYWKVPTSSSCSGISNSSAWVGIDDGTDASHDLIQTGTESDCISNGQGGYVPYYRAWWEILPANETPLDTTTYPVSAGDSMFAEVKENPTNFTITIKNVTRNWTFTTNQIYSGPLSTVEWIVERPVVGGFTTTLTNYGSAPFTNATQGVSFVNGANPQLSYANDSINMTSDGTSTGTVLSSPSNPNSNTDAYTAYYCDPTNGCPTSQPAPHEWSPNVSMGSNMYQMQGIEMSNNCFMMTGGIRPSDGYTLNSGEYYCPGSGWSGGGTFTGDRAYHTIQEVVVNTGTGQKKVLIAGGYSTRNSTYSNDGELYDESLNTWSSTATMNQSRGYLASSMLADGKVLVTGGAISGVVRSSTEVYDPIANTWTLKASMNTARYNHQQVTYTDNNGNTKVMVIGGENLSGNGLTSTEIYDPSANTWSAGPSLAHARKLAFTAVVLHDGRILVVGGEGSPANAYTNPEILDPSVSSPSWSTIASQYGHYASAVVVMGSGAGYKVLASGGYSGTGAELFDPSTNTWSTTAPMNIAPMYSTYGLLSNGQVMTAGGNTGWGNGTITDIYETFSY